MTPRVNPTSDPEGNIADALSEYKQTIEQSGETAVRAALDHFRGQIFKVLEVHKGDASKVTRIIELLSQMSSEFDARMNRRGKIGFRMPYSDSDLMNAKVREQVLNDLRDRTVTKNDPLVLSLIHVFIEKHALLSEAELAKLAGMNGSMLNRIKWRKIGLTRARALQLKAVFLERLEAWEKWIAH